MAKRGIEYIKPALWSTSALCVHCGARRSGVRLPRPNRGRRCRVPMPPAWSSRSIIVRAASDLHKSLYRGGESRQLLAGLVFSLLMPPERRIRDAARRRKDEIMPLLLRYGGGVNRLDGNLNLPIRIRRANGKGNVQN